MEKNEESARNFGKGGKSLGRREKRWERNTE